MAMFNDNRRQNPPSDQELIDNIRQKIWDRGQSLAVPGDNGWQGSLWLTQHQIISHVYARHEDIDPNIGIPEPRLDSDINYNALRIKFLDLLMQNDPETQEILKPILKTK